MYPKVIFDGRPMRLEDAKVPLNSSGVLYGSGSFTTIPIRHGHPFLGQWHFQRLSGGLVALGFKDIEFGEDKFRKALRDVCRANRVEDGLARVSIVQGPGDLWRRAKAGRAYHWWAMLKPVPPARAAAKLMISSWPLLSASPLSGVKLHNYAEPRLALAEARRCGCDEAVRLNEEGEVAGASHAAILWRKGRKYFHPAPDCGGVLSTTLAWASRELLERGTPATPGGFAFSRLRAADEIVLLSAGVGVRAVSACPGARLAGAKGELYQWLRGRYAGALDGLH